MPATATTSASWRSRRSPRRHGFAPWRRRFQGVAAEGHDRRRARAAAAARHLHERVRPRGGGGRAFLQDRRSATSSSSTTRSTCRPAKVRVKIGGGIAGHNGLRSITRACRQRLPPRAHRRRSSGRQGAGARLRAQRLRQGRARLGRGAVRRHRRQCRAAGEGRGRELPEQGAPRHGGQGLFDARTPATPTRPRATRNETDMHGFQMRHRRPAECRQVDALQRADRDRGGAGGELSVLHHRAECRRGGGARSAARRAGEASPSRRRSSRRG